MLYYLKIITPIIFLYKLKVLLLINQLEHLYDKIIDNDSLNLLNKGKKIKFSKVNKQNYNEK